MAPPPIAPLTAAEDQALRAVELLVSRLLFWGGLCSLAVLTLGLGAFLIENGLRSSNLVEALGRADLAVDNAPHVFRSLADIRGGIEAHQPLAVVAVGVVLLLALPVVSVAAVVPVFLHRGDYRYAIVSFVVLAILALSFFTGAATP